MQPLLRGGGARLTVTFCEDGSGDPRRLLSHCVGEGDLGR